jgi:hypothetical protein
MTFRIERSYGAAYPVTRGPLEEARARLVLRAPIPIRCPVHLLHGQRDPDRILATDFRGARHLRRG